MKKVFEMILCLACLISLVLAGAEKQDGSCCLIWTLGFLAFAAVCGWAWSKLNHLKTTTIL